MHAVAVYVTLPLTGEVSPDQDAPTATSFGAFCMCRRRPWDINAHAGATRATATAEYDATSSEPVHLPPTAEVEMRLTVRLLGLDLLDVELSTETPDYETGEPDYSRDLSGGTTYASAMGFTARMERPHEVETPDRDW